MEEPTLWFLVTFCFLFVVSWWLIRLIWNKSGLTCNKKYWLISGLTLITALYGAISSIDELDILSRLASGLVKSGIFIFWLYILIVPAKTKRSKLKGLKFGVAFCLLALGGAFYNALA